MRILRSRGIIALLFSLGINLSCGGGGGGGDQYSISGIVTFEGVGLSGVTMTLKFVSGLERITFTRTAITDSNGYYSFNVDGGALFSISASKYGFKFDTTWGTALIHNDISNANFEAKSCLSECPAFQTQDFHPENNFVITKSSPIIYEASSFKVWDGNDQAAFVMCTIFIDNCGGATSVDVNYIIDGQLLDQMYKFTSLGLDYALCWDGDRPTDCMPIFKLTSNSSLAMGWRYPPIGTHTWAVKATNLYSGCSVTSEVRTLVVQP